MTPTRRPLSTRFLARLPLHAPPSGGDAEWNRLWSLRNAVLLQRIAPPLRPLAAIASRLLWPFCLLKQAWLASAIPGESGGIIARAARATRWFNLGRRAHILPLQARRLVGRDRLPQPAANVQLFLTDPLIFPLLTNRAESTAIATLCDKARFAEFCRLHGLPTAPVLAAYDRGQALGERSWINLPGDLIYKPRNGFGERGVERWDWTGTGYQHHPDGEPFAPEALDAIWCRRSRERAMIVQRRLHNHPDLESLGAGEVVVVRVLSICDDRDSIGIFAPILQLPDLHRAQTKPERFVIPFAIDRETGKVGQPLRIGHRPVPPASPAEKVSGHQLPDWGEAMSLIERAHLRLPSLLLIGWDLVFTPAGPVLLEGNVQPSLTPHQFPPYPPLRRTIYGRRLVELLDGGNLANSSGQ